MSWSYSGDPKVSSKDAVRFLSGDTDTARQRATDEEIEWAISQFGNTYLAAAWVCDIVAANFGGGGLKRKKVGSLEIEYAGGSGSSGADYWTRKADQLRAQGNLGGPEATGVSVSAKAVLEGDTDAVQPNFKIGTHDNQ